MATAGDEASLQIAEIKCYFSHDVTPATSLASQPPHADTQPYQPAPLYGNGKNGRKIGNGIQTQKHTHTYNQIKKKGRAVEIERDGERDEVHANKDPP